MRLIFTLLFVLILYGACGYRTFSLLDLGACSNHSAEINLNSLSWNSSGILKASRDGLFVPNLHCVVTFIPPLSYGLVISLRSIDLQPFVTKPDECPNYLELFPTDQEDKVRLCGYSDDVFEFKSYTSKGKMNVVLHTSNSSLYEKSSFELTFTAVRKGTGWCFKDEILCRNKFCIWRDLACDGHNNCGDLSDEMDPAVSRCASMSPGESLAVILVAIVVSLILLIVAAYVRGSKISAQIERLYQCRRTNCGGNNSEAETEESTNYGPPPTYRTQPRTRLSSASALLNDSDYVNYSGVNYDPPPRYEDIPRLDVLPVFHSVTIERDPMTIERIT